MDKEQITKVEQLEDDIFYCVSVLRSILQYAGLNFSIYTIRDCESWKCMNYKCGKRHNEAVERCVRCDGEVRKPIIQSPRTTMTRKGFGHRRYTKKDITEIVNIFKQRG